MANQKFLDESGLQTYDGLIKEKISEHTDNNDIHIDSGQKSKINSAYDHAQTTHAPSSAEKNVIVKIKKNGTALTPDSSRAVNITVPTKTSELTNDSSFATSSSVTSAVNSHNSSTSAHSDIRNLISTINTRLTTVLDSDDTTLDQMSELVAYIKNNKNLIDGITTSKVNVSDIVNNLTTNVTSKVLSAAQGVAIKTLIDALQSEVDSLETTVGNKADKNHTHKYAGSSTAGGDATNALKLQGYTVNTSKPWGHIPLITTDGVVEIGKAIDFHVTSDGTSDYDARITASSTGFTLSGTTIGTFQGNLAGTASNASSANKVANALSINGKSFNGSSAVNVGTIGVAYGGTGHTTANDAANMFINSLGVGSSTPADADYYISQYVGGGTTYHRRPVSALWTYIKGKADTVYAAKSHGNHVPTTETANNAKFLRNDNTWQTVTPANIGAAASSHTHSAYVNQNAFSNVTIGSTTIAADSATDTLTLVAGSNITLTPDSANDKITIAATDTKYSAGTGISLSGTTFSNSGVRSIATGTSNGTISVNTNGTTANVAVKGLGSAAYTNSSAYATAGHNHDSSYVNVSGDNMSGRLTLNTSVEDHSDPTKQCLVINCGQVPEGTTLTDKNAPGIGFHIGSNSWGSLVFRDSAFRFINNSATGYFSVVASKFVGALQGNADTATKVYHTATNPSSGTTYYIPFVNGASSANRSMLSNDGLRYWTKEGTTSANGEAQLGLGNNIATGTAANKRGSIYMYGTSSGYTQIYPGNNSTSNITITLPSAGGTLARTVDNVASANRLSMQTSAKSCTATGLHVITAGGAASGNTVDYSVDTPNTYSSSVCYGTILRVKYDNSTVYYTDIWVDTNSNNIYTKTVSNGTSKGWQRLLTNTNYSSYALPLSGGTLSGNVISSKSDATYLQHKVSNSNGAVGIYAATNRGLYDFTNEKWMIYTGSNGVVTVNGNVTGSSGSCTGNAASATKVNTNLVIKLNGGSTEGTNLFTFNGSSAKTINITPSAIGAAASSHSHSYLPLACSASTPLTGGLYFKTNSYSGDIIGANGSAQKRWELYSNSSSGAVANAVLRVYNNTAGSTYATYTFGTNGTLTATAFSGSLSGNASSANALSQVAYVIEKSTTGTRYVKIADVQCGSSYHRVNLTLLLSWRCEAAIVTISLTSPNSTLFTDYRVSYTPLTANASTLISSLHAGIVSVSSTVNKFELWYQQAQWGQNLCIRELGRNYDNKTVSFYNYSATDAGSTSAPTFTTAITIANMDKNTTYSLSSFGLTATATELNYCDGVTSNIQTQLNGKAASGHNHNNVYVYDKANCSGTFNDVAAFRNAMGMVNISAPSDGTASYVNPNGQTGWHHFINISYPTESNNMWQTQIANKAGTTDLWVRSRSGSAISTSTAWAAPWTRILTGSNWTNVVTTSALKALPLACSSSTPLTGPLYFKTNSWAGNILGTNASGQKRWEFYSNSNSGAVAATILRVYSATDGSTYVNYTFGTDGTLTATKFSGSLSGNATSASGVTQGATSTGNYRALLMGTGHNADPTTLGASETGQLYKVASIYAQPSTGTIFATALASDTWRSPTYGGGWYMSDANWIRTYGSKNIYQNSGILRTDGTLQVGNGGAYFKASSAGTTISPCLTIDGYLTINCTTDANGTADKKSGIRVGNLSGEHIMIDGNEIMAKDDTTTPGGLMLNAAGGTVHVNNELPGHISFFNKDNASHIKSDSNLILVGSKYDDTHPGSISLRVAGYWASSSDYLNGTFQLQDKNTTTMFSMKFDSSGPYMNSIAIYNRTTSAGTAVRIDSAGVLYRYSSASKYKSDIQPIDDDSYAYNILKLKPKTWYDKEELNAYTRAVEAEIEGKNPTDVMAGFTNTSIDRIPGLVAEDVEKAGLGDYCTYEVNTEKDTKELEGINYEKVTTLLIPIVRDLVVTMQNVLPYVDDERMDDTTKTKLNNLLAKFNSFNETDVIS